MIHEKPQKPDIRETADDFVAAVELDENRTILVYRREHGGRRFVRMRTWNRHREPPHYWYPSRRYFVVKLEAAEALAEAIIAAARGENHSEMPEWLVKFEKDRDRRLLKLKDLNAPEKMMNDEMRRRKRAAGESWPKRRKLISAGL